MTDLSFAFTPGTKPDDPGTLKDVTLTYLPAQTTETGSITCPGAPAQPFSTLTWSAMYLGIHASERATARGRLRDEGVEGQAGGQDGHQGVGPEPPRRPASATQGTFELYHEPR